jgi:hypothetical protein
MPQLDKFEYTCKAYFQQSADLPELSAAHLACFKQIPYLGNAYLLTIQLVTLLMVT